MTVIALLAVLALSAAVAGSASANWFVGGTELKTSAALATTTVVDEPSTLLVPTLSLSIVCSGKTLDGTSPEIIAGNIGKAASLKFLECNTTKPATGCALETANEPIPTLPVSARASLGSGEADRVLFVPQTKGTFAEIKFSEADTCALGPALILKGAVTFGAPTGQLELLNQAIVGLGSIENNSLEIGSGNKAFIDGGKVLLRLASDSKWSFK